MKIKDRPLHLTLLVLVVFAYIISGIDPVSRFAWLAQTAAGTMLAGALLIMYPKFRFTNFTYIMVFLHILLLVYAAHYTYSQTPLFNDLKNIFGWQRNHFDRVGHFAQGFVPTFLFKEVYLRGGFVRPGRMLKFIVIISCLGFSGFYELAEFAMVKILDVPVDDIMGTQGDFFDSHWDMFWALTGATLATLAVGPFHDRQIEKMADPSDSPFSR